jgi:hypothetical protein
LRENMLRGNVVSSTRSLPSVDVSGRNIFVGTSSVRRPLFASAKVLRRNCHAVENSCRRNSILSMMLREWSSPWNPWSHNTCCFVLAVISCGSSRVAGSVSATKSREQWDEREGSAESVLKSSSSPRPPLSRSFAGRVAPGDGCAVEGFCCGVCLSSASFSSVNGPRRDLIATLVFLCGATSLPNVSWRRRRSESKCRHRLRLA